MGGPPLSLKREEASRLLNDASTHGFTILSICLFKYDDYFELDFLEVLSRLKDDFNVNLHQALESKLQAITVSMTTDSFETEPSVFDSVCKALATGDPDIESPDLNDLQAGEMLWGQYEVELTRGGEITYSPRVDAYRDKVGQQVQSEEEITDVTEDLQEQRAKLRGDLESVGFDAESLPDF